MPLQAAIDQRNEIAEMLWNKQRADPSDLTLAHDIGLFHYWWAKALEQEEAFDVADEAWRQVIANWSMVLEDDVFWQDWCGRKSKVYGVDIPQDDIQAVRGQLKERLQASLTDYSSRCNRGSRNDRTLEGAPLDLVFELETRAIQALKHTGGFPAPDDEGQKVVCGPLMLRRLGLSSAFSQFIASLRPVDSEVSDMFTRLLQLLTEDLDESLFDTKARKKLMQYFSQLGIPSVYLDRSQPQQALVVLGTRCRRWADLADESTGGSGMRAKRLPFVCHERCPQFDKCNPAYAAIDNGDQVLFEHATGLAIEARMRMAELFIAAEQMKIQRAFVEWQEAVSLAEALGKAEETHSAIMEMIIGRAIALGKGNRLDEAIGLLDATANLYQDDRLRGKLAELLTNRGVKAGNQERWEDAVESLRRAHQLNTHVPRTRDNFVVALRGYAAHCHSKDDHDQAKELLKEALGILKAEAAADRDNPLLREQLSRVRTELAMVSGVEGGLLGVLSGLLAAAIGEDITEGTEASARSLEFRGAMLAAQGQFAEAEREFKKAIEASPGHKRPLIGLSKLYAQMKNVEGVIETQRRIAELDPTERFNAQVNIGGVFQQVKDYSNALEHFRQAVAVAEDDGQRSHAYKLVGDVLILQRRFEEAEAALDRSLELNPRNTGTRASQRALQLARVVHRDEPTDTVRILGHLLEALAVAEETEDREEPDTWHTQDAEESERKGGLRGFLARLTGQGRREAVETEKEGRSRLRQESPLDIVRRYLDETNLKYRRLLRDTFILPFGGHTIDTIMARLRVMDDMAIISASLPEAPIDEANVLYNLLRATYTADIYKLCRDSDGDLLIAAEVPVSVLDAEILERLIRNVVDLVDLEPVAFGNFDRVTMRAKQLQMGSTLKTMWTSRGGERDEAHLLIPSLARRLGIQCERRREARFLLTFGEMDLRVVASCRGKAVSFVALMSGLRPYRGNRRHYRRMAEINMRMDVCKVALDSDDDVAFKYELPGLNEEAFNQMVRRMDEYVMRFGMELALLA